MNDDSLQPPPDPSDTTNAGSGGPRGTKAVGFRIAAVLLGILPFILLEAGLRLLDHGSRRADPLAGFSRQLPLFEHVGPVYQTLRSREPYFGPQQFATEKPTNGFRIFCFGGSTIYGHPYVSDTAIPKWLELELAARAPGRHVEVVNCGGVSYASYRLAPIVSEVLQYQPDLIVVATGENEFLEDRTYHAVKTRSGFRRWIEDRLYSLRTVTWLLQHFSRETADQGIQPASDDSQLPVEVKTRLDDARSGYASYHRDDTWHQQVIQQFEDSIRAMIGECRSAKIPFILVTLGSNLRDCPPYKSEHRTALSPEDENRWQLLFDAGTATETNNVKGALELYRQAEAIDGEFALLEFRIARCLDRMGEIDQAREHFIRAKDQDICPLRMLETVYQLQHQVATETGTPVVDARKLLEGLSPDALPGNDLYLDHVHPSIGGDQKIAAAVAAKLIEMRLLPEATAWTAEARRDTYRQQFERLDPSYFSNGRRRVDWLENWARRKLLFDETLPKDAVGFLRHGFRHLDLGADEPAWKSFDSALAMNPTLAKQILAHASELHDEGRPESALRLLNQLRQRVADAGLRGEIQEAIQRLRPVQSAGSPTPSR